MLKEKLASNKTSKKIFNPLLKNIIECLICTADYGILLSFIPTFFAAE
jgi:hypothetical protein